MDQHSDFYILDTAGYKKCHHRIHQADMNVLATQDNVVRKWMTNLYTKCILPTNASYQFNY